MSDMICAERSKSIPPSSLKPPEECANIFHLTSFPAGTRDLLLYCSQWALEAHMNIEPGLVSKLLAVSQIMLIGPLLQIRFSVSTEKTDTWTSIQPYSLGLCPYITLHTQLKLRYWTGGTRIETVLTGTWTWAFLSNQFFSRTHCTFFDHHVTTAMNAKRKKNKLRGLLTWIRTQSSCTAPIWRTS